MNDLLDLPAASKSIHSAGRVLIRTISSLAATAASDPQQPSVAASLIMAAVHLYVLATCSLVISMLRADLSAAQSTDGQSVICPYLLLNDQLQKGTLQITLSIKIIRLTRLQAG
jgi:hypothetical protein